MRATVLASDAAVWLPCALAALVVFSSSSSSSSSSRRRGGGRGGEERRKQRAPLLQRLPWWPAAAVLLQPALVLVDHGHFQFNGIGLGLAALAAAAAATDKRILSSILFTCSLNHKQMALYYAPAFFGHLLGRCLQSAAGRASKGAQKAAATKNKKTKSSDSEETTPSSSSSLLLFLLRAGLRAAALGLTVALTMLALWWPVISKNKRGPAAGALAVLSRLAPVHRGIFEDYVANFWCASHPLFRWKRRFSKEQLARAAAALTLAAAAPSALHQALRPSRRGTLYAMACSSLAFYLFSYQVHEKSILLPLLPVSLLALPTGSGAEGKKEKKKEREEKGLLSLVAAGPPSEPFLACWLPVAACFSMWPLLHRDGLAWSYAGCLLLWAGAVAASRPPGEAEEEEEEEEGRGGKERRRRKRTKAELALLYSYGPAAFVGGALALHACHALVSAPASLPWLWDAAIVTYCAPAFLAAFAYLNVRMWLGTLEEEGEGREETTTPTTIRRAPPRRAGRAAARAPSSSSSRAKRD